MAGGAVKDGWTPEERAPYPYPSAPDPAIAPVALQRLIDWALEEDVWRGDLTTMLTVPRGAPGAAVVVAKEEMVVAGGDAARQVFLTCDPELRVEELVQEGRRALAGDEVLRVRGSLRGILTAERTALNFLGRLSGIATLTRRFVDAVEGTGARILDTRKTTPGWRVLEKAAVRAGGGFNHRIGLYDFILVKDNHIAAAGGITEAVRRVREGNRAGLPVEVEVTSVEELEEALGLGVERLLLDNMPLDGLERAVRRARELSAPRPSPEASGDSSPGFPHGRVEGENFRRVAEAGVPFPQLEASGNVTLENVRSVAGTGVDFVSVGALTHSARSADLSLRVER